MAQRTQPLYETIKNDIRDAIRSGRYAPGDRIPSTRELCEVHSASLVSVRRAVKDLSKEGVLRGENGRGVFVQNMPVATARHTATPAQADRVIIGVWNAVIDENIVHIQEGMARFASEKGMGIELYSGNPDELLPLQQMAARGIPGAIIFGNSHPSYVESLQALIHQGFHFVSVDRSIDALPLHVVASDHYGGALLATAHLLRHAGMAVHYLGVEDESSAATERQAGYRDAMSRAGFTQADITSLVHRINIDFTCSTWQPDDLRRLHQQPVLQILRHIELPTCIFCQNDYVAQGVYDAAQELGAIVGHDLFLVGYDDLTFARRLRPSLSSVRQDFTMIGYRAAALLDDLIRGDLPKNSPPVQMKIPVELVHRESSVKTANASIAASN
ncbi:MAG: substrate-binding domain-containing protein [Lentisphaerae bacterium]|nr:substrate-binding domain-containing protein [Lentisphaerota bacterium]